MKNRKFLLHTWTIEDRHRETDYNRIKSEVLKISLEFVSSGKTKKITNQNILNCIYEKLNIIL